MKNPTEPLKYGNHWYIVYDYLGDEVDFVQAKSHNGAEAIAQKRYGPKASVAYAEI